MPAARCGPGERTESGLQGQTTSAERFSGQGRQAYTCNLELVGQWVGEGGAWGMTVSNPCAYFSSAPAGTVAAARRQYPGVAVVDASDPRHPKGLESLATPAMLTPNETIEAHTGRKLLAGIQSFFSAPTGDSGSRPAVFEVYDISNCGHPELMASLTMPPGMLWHAAQFAPNGRTYYATSWGGKPEEDGFIAIDLSDPAKPREMFRWFAPTSDVAPHWLALNDDGTRMYVGVAGSQGRRNGIAVFDVSDIEHRRPEPRINVLGTLYWNEGTIGQIPIPLKIKGTPYVIYMDFGGGTGSNLAAVKSACVQGVPPFGFAHLIDISDERKPVTAARLLLQVHDPANCGQLLPDPASLRSGYSGMVCIPDDPQDASIIACTWKEAGLRVFDIRNPTRPVELAYYKSPGVRRNAPAGSVATTSKRFPDADHTADWAIRPARFDKGRGEIWFMSQDNGLQIVRFTDRFRKERSDLFSVR